MPDTKAIAQLTITTWAVVRFADHPGDNDYRTDLEHDAGQWCRGHQWVSIYLFHHFPFIFFKHAMKKNDTRYIIVSRKEDSQLFLCLMRHIINTITLFGKFHILQVYRTRFFCVLPNSVTHLSTCICTLDTVHNGHYALFSFFLFFSSFICML